RLAGPTYAWFAGWLYVWTIMLTVTAIAYFGAVWLAGLFDVTPSPNQQVLWAFAILVVTTLVNGIGLNPLKYVVNVGIVAEFIACGIAVQASATRVLFSLSRDRMLPGSAVISRVGRNRVPMGALAVAAVVSAAGLLFGLDTRAVNTLITFGSGGYYITFWL